MLDPPLEHKKRPKQLRVVMCPLEVLADQCPCTIWVEETAFRDCLLAQTAFELTAELVSEPPQPLRSADKTMRAVSNLAQRMFPPESGRAQIRRNPAPIPGFAGVT